MRILCIAKDFHILSTKITVCKTFGKGHENYLQEDRQRHTKIFTSGPLRLMSQWLEKFSSVLVIGRSCVQVPAALYQRCLKSYQLACHARPSKRQSLRRARHDSDIFIFFFFLCSL